MTKGEIKKRHHTLRQLRDRVCLEAEDLQTRSKKLREESDRLEKVVNAINVVLDSLEELM